MPQGSFVHQPDLEEVLAAAAADAGIVVERGAEVSGLIQDDAGVTVGVRDPDGGPDRSVGPPRSSAATAPTAPCAT